MSTPQAVPSAPPWPYCEHGADPATDPIGCRGIHVPGHRACLAHLTDSARDTYLVGLVPGADIDHRGTLFTEDLLDRFLHALRDPTTEKPHLGDARFGGAQFSGTADFGGAQFTGDAWFDGAQFTGPARFDRVQFSSIVRFDRAQFSDRASFSESLFGGGTWFVRTQFSGGAWFGGAQFSGTARFAEAQFSDEAAFGEAQFSRDSVFRGAQFSGTVRFDDALFCGRAGFGEARFSGDARFVRVQFSGSAGFDAALFSGHAGFDGAQFNGSARFPRVQFTGTARFYDAQFAGTVLFGGAKFSGNAVFVEAQFAMASRMGPVVCAGALDLSGAVFEVPVTLEIASHEVRCVRTRWESTATVRLRYATVDLSHAVFAAPVAVTSHPAPFTAGPGRPVDESVLSGPAGARMASVQGVDAAHLVLTDTNLSDCLFSGAFHLDQVRLEGRTVFAPAPTGWHRRGIRIIRWTRRRTLAEEHHWRAQTTAQPSPPPGHTGTPDHWRAGPHHPNPAQTPDPDDVAALYRQLRKAFEDGKNEPGAADFYYGECEMRRHDLTGTPTSERRLLWGYWLLSGYGLRASRAFVWLLAAMSLTILFLMGVGLPTHDPDPATTGTLHGSALSLHTTTPDPALHGDVSRRFTWPRTEKATRVAVNSVVFRSSGQNLTTAGTYIEMTSRLMEPTLLGLAVLAVRGRIKR
ncbi:pentapeptide repeat-containing protein [Streptomyces sp. Mo3]|uniref:pentapeptide repeat-containing protein n=1 Tax=Streptomyces sp. Mo3 TaxID=3161190 RepID=UPI0039EFF29A